MNTQKHPLEEVLEAFAIGRLSEDESGEVEDHLLICDQCRVRFGEVENFVQATRTAAARIRQEESAVVLDEKPGFKWRQTIAAVMNRPVWLMAGVAAIGAVLILPRMQNESEAVREVTLTTTRGNDSVIGATDSKTRWRLKLDVRQLQRPADYRVVLADAAGETLMESEISATEAETTNWEIARRLSAGTYWVRIFDRTKGGKLLREYPLALE